jgi:hypothetical protein
MERKNLITTSLQCLVDNSTTSGIFITALRDRQLYCRELRIDFSKTPFFDHSTADRTAQLRKTNNDIGS